MGLYVPCVTCDGKGVEVCSTTHDVLTCVSCLGEGKHEVSQSEYDKFWKVFDKEDFKRK